MKLCNRNKGSLKLTASHITDYPVTMTRTSGSLTVEKDATQNLLESLNTNSFSRIRSALQVPCLDLNYRDPQSDSQTLLMRICRLDLTPRSRCDLIKMVLEKPGRKIDVNSLDMKGMSALAHACKAGDDNVVRMLAAGADVDPNVADLQGNTPLMHACQCGKTNVVNTLMACFGPTELNIDQSNNQGKPLRTLDVTLFNFKLKDEMESESLDDIRRFITSHLNVASFNCAQTGTH